jgi:hypothetical protein
LTTSGEIDVSALEYFYAVCAFVILPAALVLAYLTHRQRLEDEAAEAEEASRTAAE